MVLDGLDFLEWYRSLHPDMQQVIDILDRGEVYEQEKGTYQVEKVDYQIQTYTTNELGTLVEAAQDQLQVVLEGEELFSLQSNESPELVSTLTTGMFVFTRRGEVYRRRQSVSGVKAVKKVVFNLTQPVS